MSFYWEDEVAAYRSAVSAGENPKAPPMTAEEFLHRVTGGLWQEGADLNLRQLKTRAERLALITAYSAAKAAEGRYDKAELLRVEALLSEMPGGKASAGVALLKERLATLEEENVRLRAGLMTPPHERSPEERAALFPRLEALSNHLCQTQSYILGALESAGLTVALRAKEASNPSE